MRRIERPDWAPEHARTQSAQRDDDVTLADFERVQSCRAALLEAHHRAVEVYYDKCTLPEADSFPYRGALTGEYYLSGRESYWRADGAIIVSIMAHCLGVRAHGTTKEAQDYLGIDVFLRFDLKTGTFTTYYIGGQVI
jgi:hypothetical protein